MKQIPFDLIQKYLRGECSLDEERVVIEWYNSYENKPDPYNELTPLEQRLLRERMLTQVELVIYQSDRADNVRFKYLKHVVYLLIATAAIIIFIINPQLFFSGFKSNVKNSSLSDEEITITNKTNSIQKQILPDQSIVWLSPNAQIKFLKIFKRKNREVSLLGESFFEVTKDKAHPFVVYSKHIVTKVWGTSFRVRDLNTSQTADVTVVTGKVSVEIVHGFRASSSSNKRNLENVMLFPRQMAIYETAHDVLHVNRTVEKSSVNIWEKTSLSFNNVALSEVIKTLDKQYNVDIVLPDKSLNGYMLQADFSNQSLPDILEMLKKLLKLNYVTDGKRFLLQKY